MNTYEEQKSFFFSHWDSIKEVLENGGAASAVDYINSQDDPLHRRVLYFFAKQGLVNSEWKGKNLDDYITVIDAGIAELLSQAESEEDDELRIRRIDLANMMSYNLSADLAHCWEDDFERNESHFRRGLQAAEDCIRWRTELNKPAWPFSIAHWARGIHHLALGNLEPALADFEQSWAYGKKVAEENGEPTEVSSEAGFGVLLANGWVALTKVMMGDESERPRYEQVITLFNENLSSDDEHTRGDAKVGLEQLEKVRKSSEH